MRRLLILALALFATGGVALAQGGAGTSTESVTVGDNYFETRSGVPTVSASRGETVRWRWTGRNSHNVTVTRGPQKFRSRTMRSGTFSRKPARGTYTIICTIHGARDQSMRLVVR